MRKSLVKNKVFLMAKVVINDEKKRDRDWISASELDYAMIG